MTKEPVPISSVMKAGLKRLAERRREFENDPVYRAAVEARIAEDAACQAEEARFWQRAALDASGVPRKFLNMIEGLEDWEPLRAVREWLSGTKTFLFLTGDVDVGKTFAASWALLRAFEEDQLEQKGIERAAQAALAEGGPGAAMATWSSRARRHVHGGLFRTAQEIASISQYDKEGWERLYRTPFLVIDDLGTERTDAKDWGVGAIRALICRRHADEARTVVTLNVCFETFLERYGQDGGRLHRRLKEAAEWVEIAAPRREEEHEKEPAQAAR